MGICFLLSVHGHWATRSLRKPVVFDQVLVRLWVAVLFEPFVPQSFYEALKSLMKHPCHIFGGLWIFCNCNHKSWKRTDNSPGILMNNFTKTKEGMFSFFWIDNIDKMPAPILTKMLEMWRQHLRTYESKPAKCNSCIFVQVRRDIRQFNERNQSLKKRRYKFADTSSSMESDFA
mmetsp:Transcript_1225/g.2841  ORF Transcript_1225/g.2841 Transcript_1225/m.2841 type:complete len:175 (+) Transcript_1225:163-687(+)